MNFVCFSFLSPPATDAESACTGRLLSSLAEEGHCVTLVSLDHGSEAVHLPDEIADQLLSSKVKVIRVPITHYGRGRRLLSKLRYGLFGICTEYITECVRLVNQELAKNDSPVLLTRSAWPASNLVGWYCRKNARCWIPHFSDPFPSYKKMTRSEWWRYPFCWMWLMRIVCSATSVSVTNRHALIYFKKILPGFLLKKFFVLYHIGAPRIRSIGYAVPRQPGEKILVVAGALFKGRGYDAIRAIISQVPGCRLIEYSGGNLRSLCPGIDDCLVQAPAFVTDAMASADAIVVSDLDSNFGYCPYLPSKFAYAAVLRKPIICVSEPNSEMYEFSQKYSGIYFCDRARLESMRDILADLQQGKLLPASSDCGDLFGQESVVSVLTQRIDTVEKNQDYQGV